MKNYYSEYINNPQKAAKEPEKREITKITQTGNAGRNRDDPPYVREGQPQGSWAEQ